MKHTKKLIGFLLALTLLLSMNIPAFAAGGVMEGEETGGKITVSDAELDETYNLYQILYLDSFDDTGVTEGTDGNPSGGNYSYKPNSEWKAFIDSVTIGTDNKKVFNIDENDVVTWIYDSTEKRFAEQVANKALAYAKEKNIQPVASYDPDTMTASEVVFDGLKLGYYLLDSTLGSLCSLDTTNREISIYDKNEKPVNVKEVKENNLENGWGNITSTSLPFNDANIGEKVEFKSAITVKKGTENLFFHDTMSPGLTLDESSVKLYYSPEGTSDETPIAPSHYQLIMKGSGATDEVIAEEAEECTFHIKFLEGFYTALHDGEAASYTITVKYSATLNTNAVVGVDGNPNESKVSYGEKNNTTTPSKTLTKTWEIPVFKYTGEGTAIKGLDNTKFTLKKNADKQIIKFVQIESGIKSGEDDTEAVYRVATQEEIDAANDPATPEGEKPKIYDVITTNKSGKFKLSGLDSATYLLEETEAHSGYNKLKEPISVVIDKDSIKQNNTPTNTIGIHNGTGTELPATGGIGTTIFYAAGSALLLAAVVLLVTKKRMGADK